MRAPAFLRFCHRLRRDTGAFSMVEFALSLPFLLILALGGMETANFINTDMRINQIAVSLADNASRLKQQTISGAPKVREYDVNEAFKAAEHQGRDLGLMQHGRLILSSLEATGTKQWFHWQRCQGQKASYKSAFGNEKAILAGGVGPAGQKISAEADSAIMVAEVIYDYQPVIMETMFKDMQIRKYFSMYVRDDRDLSNAGISNLSPQVTVSNC